MTPRTDAARLTVEERTRPVLCLPELVPANFARTLELELAEMTQQRDKAQSERDFDPAVSSCVKGHDFRTTPNTPAKSEREWECPHCAVNERNEIARRFVVAREALVRYADSCSWKVNSFTDGNGINFNGFGPARAALAAIDAP